MDRIDATGAGDRYCGGLGLELFRRRPGGNFRKLMELRSVVKYQTQPHYSRSQMGIHKSLPPE